MKKLSVKTIRELVKQLNSPAVLPRDPAVFTPIELCDGIVYFGSSAMHPSSFLDTYGIMRFRKLKRDVPKQMIEDYIKVWKKNRKK